MRIWKKKLIQYLVKNLLAGVTIEDILTTTNTGWYLKGRKLTPEEVTQLKEEAHSFKDSVLWSVMLNEIRYLANLRMFEQAIVPENTVFGRAMLYNIEILEKFINRVSK